MNWIPPQRPAAYAEYSLVEAILSGKFPPGSMLPAERDLAAQLGVTRPTLREALQRLERDGWLDIQHGKTTQVKDYWKQGGLNVLSALARHLPDGWQALPPTFIIHLLEVRLALAPAYTRLAVEQNPQSIGGYLSGTTALQETGEAYAVYDWKLHHLLTTASGNPIFTLILNGFEAIYLSMAPRYFSRQTARYASRNFYLALADAAGRQDPQAAETITRLAMQESIRLWQD